MKKIVIAGSTGTIGVALVNYLTDLGIDCVLINVPEFVDKKAYKNTNRICFIDGSIGEYKELDRKTNLPSDCDGFIHLAWAGAFGPNRDNVSLQLKNIEGVLDALDLAKKMGCKAFLGAGSQAEYGSGVENEPHTISPVTGYGIAKYSASQLGRLKAAQIGIKFNWVRIFSVFGPNQNPNSLTQYVIDSLLKGISPKLTKCEQIWDFLYTEDAAAALYSILSDGKNGTIYELGSGNADTLRHYIEKIPHILNINVPIDFGALQYPSNQVMKMCADVSKLVNDTSWRPKFTFEEGIKKIALTK